MKGAALAVGLVALCVGLFGVFGPMQSYVDVNERWTNAYPQVTASSVPGAQEAVDRLGEERTDLRGRCQLFVFGAGVLALAALILSILVRRKESGLLPNLAVVCALLALVPPIILLTADVF